jgi:putative ABC transport system ATP-binding protein
MIIFMNIVETNNLKKYYGKDPNITKALDGVSLSISKGSFTAIVGTSGSGKTTLLNMLGGLDTPTEGTVIIGEKQIHSMNDEQLTIFRRRNIGFVFQNYNLVPILNIYENIMLPSDLDGDTVDKSYLEKIVQLLGLREKLYNMPNQLSGGQQQRVAIARALAGKPAILLADEPTGNLDSKSSANVMEILKQANLSFGQTIVMITHNELLAQMVDTIIRIEDGRIAESR